MKRVILTFMYLGKNMKKAIFILFLSLIGSVLFSQSLEGPIKVWGWSRDGKVAISEYYDPSNGEGRGGI